MPALNSTADAVLVDTPSVTTTTPTSAQTGVALQQDVIVNFDIAIDKDSVNLGHLILTTPANKVAATGPGLFDQLLSNNLVTENLLDTPSLTGVVAGTITFNDTFTQATLNPTEPLESNKTYTVLVSDEVVSRTLTVPAAAGGNTGTGNLTAEGPYTGTYVADTYTVEITTGGALASAVFRWQKASEGVWQTGTVVDRRIELDLGIVLRFGAGVYDAGDIWTFDATIGIPLAATYSFSFTTGSPTHTTPSVQTESNEMLLEEVGGITRITSSPTPGGVGLKVLSIEPATYATDLDLTQKEIRITFNKALDATTIDDDSVQIFMETLPTDHNERKSEPLRKRITINGAVMTISLDGV